MEMELEAGTEGPELTLNLGDNRFRKRSSFAHRDDAPLPRHIAHCGQQNGVPKRRTLAGRIDGEDIAPPRQTDPGTKSGGDRHAVESSQRGASVLVLSVAHRTGPTGRR